jgi:AraC-like DNA-binding protein
MTDRLSSLIHRFELRADVFHSGSVRGMTGLRMRSGVSHLHLVHRGLVTATYGASGRQTISEPSALFLPRPVTYRLDADDPDDTEVVSAAIQFGGVDENPILRGLPDLLVTPLTCVPSLDTVQQLLFQEASARRCGHVAVVSRLAEILMVELLRYAMRRQLVDGGSLAGLSDARLAKALTAMHVDPSHPWTVETMAEAAGMSRSRFAAHFAAIVGIPPGEYLMRWRIGLAKALLRRGRPVKQVALDVGYGSASALARAFAQGEGTPPTAWLAAQAEQA